MADAVCPLPENKIKINLTILTRLILQAIPTVVILALHSRLYSSSMYFPPTTGAVEAYKNGSPRSQAISYAATR